MFLSGCHKLPGYGCLYVRLKVIELLFRAILYFNELLYKLSILKFQFGRFIFFYFNHNPESDDSTKYIKDAKSLYIAK